MHEREGRWVHRYRISHDSKWAHGGKGSKEGQEEYDACPPACGTAGGNGDEQGVTTRRRVMGAGR